MAYDFPNSPTPGTTYSGYVWDGEKWIATTTPSPPNQSGVISIQVFTASGSYTPSANMTTCVVECWGGGGGGGAVNGVTTSTLIGGGGGGGGYSRSTLTAAAVGIAKAIVIGAGGTNLFSAGGVGGQTSFGGTIVVANGGTGGAASGFTVNATPGGAPGTGHFAVPGPCAIAMHGDTGTTATVAVGGTGASTMVGTGGSPGQASVSGAVGNGAIGYASGGGGAAVNKAVATPVGGAGAPGLCVVTEYGMTALSSASAQLGSVRYDLPQGLTSTQMAQGRANIAAPLRGWIAGLTLSAAGSSATFGIAAGEAANSTNIALMQLASAYTKTTGAWAVGTGNGALDTGAIAAASWYHVFLIQRPDTGVVDVLVSLSATAPTLPANYTLFRRIGSLKTTASLWAKFNQNGDEFLWDAMVASVTGGTGDTVAHTAALAVPTGVKMLATLNVGTSGGAGADGRAYVSSLDSSDEIPGVVNWNAGGIGATGTQVWAKMQVRTDTSAQIRYRLYLAAVQLWIGTAGWIDRRGRDD